MTKLKFVSAKVAAKWPEGSAVLCTADGMFWVAPKIRGYIAGDIIGVKFALLRRGPRKVKGGKR